VKKAFPPALATSAAALVLLLLVQVMIGWVLHTAYRPTPAEAHASVEAIRAQPFLGALRSFHFWGSMWLLVHSFLHVAALLFTGSFQKPNEWRWVAAVTIFVCVWLLQVTGTLLPFDRHAVQTANIEASIASRVPLVGEDLALGILGGESFGEATLSRWYLIHRWIAPGLALLMLLAAFLAYAGQREVRHSRLIALLPLIALVAVAYWVRPPHGSPASAEDFVAMNALVNWYNWPLHGALMAFESISPGLGWVGAMLLPLLFVVFLYSLPAFADRTTTTFVGIIFASFLAVFLGLGVAFGGMVAPVLGDRDRGVVEAAPSPAPVIEQVPKLDPRLAEWGRRHFNQVGCANCHGADAQNPTLAPNLLDPGRRRPDPEFYIRYIRDPRSMNPASTMPPFPNLREEQLRAIAEFLRRPATTPAGTQP
jgi:mono/diheme cytochrome c family protein